MRKKYKEILGTSYREILLPINAVDTIRTILGAINRNLDLGGKPNYFISKKSFQNTSF